MMLNTCLDTSTVLCSHAESAFAGALSPPDSPPEPQEGASTDPQEGLPHPEAMPSNAAMDARTAPHLARSSSHGLGSGESQGSGRMNAPAWLHVPRARSGPAMARIPSWLHFQTLGKTNPQKTEACCLL